MEVKRNLNLNQLLFLKHKVFLFVWITTINDLDGNSYVIKLIGNYDDEFIAPNGFDEQNGL